jgi:hypothetical protein
MERTDPSLVTQSWVGVKPYFMTIDIRAFMTVTRPDMDAEWPERQPNQCYVLQMVSGEFLPTLKEVFLTLTLWRRPPKMWVFVANILGLDILCTYDVSVDPLTEEEVVANDQVIPAQCKRVVMAQLESPLRVENGLVEPSLEAHAPEGLYIASTLV